MSNTISKVIHNGTEFEFESVNGGVTSVNGQTGAVVTFYNQSTPPLSASNGDFRWVAGTFNEFLQVRKGGEWVRVAPDEVIVSASTPTTPTPTEGQLWYDTSNDVLKSYNGTNWNEVGSTYTAGTNISINNNTISAVDTTYNAWEGIEIKNGDDYSAMRGPAPRGYHIPSKNEWSALCMILTTTFSMASNATTMGTYLKMPKAGYRGYSSSNVLGLGTYGYYWSSTPYGTNNAYNLVFDSSLIGSQNNRERAYGLSVRCFKDAPIIPTSSWTTLYDGSSVATGAGIFYNATDGLISVSGNGTTWYTIQDKNLGATAVYNQEDTETDANCGYFYQWGNNYGFAHSGTITTSSTKVDASNYGPGNYYSSSTFITVSASPYNWSSVQNDNLWGATTGVVTLNNAITNKGVLSVNGQDGDVVIPTVEESNTKTFYLSSTSDLTTAQAAYDWYVAGKNSIIVYNNEQYLFENTQSSTTVFKSVDTKTEISYSREDKIYYNRLIFDKSSDTITGIRTQQVQIASTLPLGTSSSYTGTYNPSNNYNPATKKYVDDHAGIPNDTTGTTSSIGAEWVGTQAEFDALSSYSNKIYNIIE